MKLAPDVSVVLLQGRHAERAWGRLLKLEPAIGQDRALSIVRTWHPSPQALFVRDPKQRAARVNRRREAFFEVAQLLRGRST